MTFHQNQFGHRQIAVEELQIWLQEFEGSPTTTLIKNYSIVSVSPEFQPASLLAMNAAPSGPVKILRKTWQELCQLNDLDRDYEGILMVLRQVRGTIGSVQSYCFYARALWGKREYREAEVWLRTALTIAPTHSFALELLGETLYFSKDYHAALDYISKSISYNPNYGRAYMARALIYDVLATQSDSNEARARYYENELRDLKSATNLLPKKAAIIAPAVLHAKLLLEEFTA